MSEVVMIKTNLINPHEKNPRKDLGDLAELAESIKAQGVLQNLTVVANDDGTYTCVIGHRRLAASIEAGLDEVPCVVSDMDEKTQVSTMLLENMQRIDLTVLEQAQGFQMCLDLGLTVKELSEKTGFSKKTVNHRLKILELDQGKIQEKLENNVVITLDDYIRLEQIKDINLRNKALKDIGTYNFPYAIRSMVELEKKRKLQAKYVEQISAFAELIKIADMPDNYARMKAYYLSSEEMETVDIPMDFETTKYYFTADDWDVSVYEPGDEKVKKREPSTYEIEQKERQERISQFEEVWKNISDIRDEFMKETISKKLTDQQKGEINYYFVWTSLEGGVEIDEVKNLNELFSCELIHEDDAGEQTVSKDVEKKGNILLAVLYLSMKNSYSYYNAIPNVNWKLEFQNDERESMLLKMLCCLGYQPSSVEEQILKGTHELYTKVEKSEETD